MNVFLGNDVNTGFADSSASDDSSLSHPTNRHMHSFLSLAIFTEQRSVVYCDAAEHV